MRRFIPAAAALLSLFIAVGARSDDAAPPTTVPAAPALTGSAVAAAIGPAAVIRLEGEVDDHNRDQLFRNFSRARAAGAKTIILEINTNGGPVIPGLDVSRFLKNQTDLHVIAFVNAKAISAGAMIAMACDEIVMTPSGSLGDCAPIEFASAGGVVPMLPTERSKQESPILADFSESARRNGHDPLLACAMVSMSHTVYWVQDNGGIRRFVNEADFKTLTVDGAWKPVPGAPSPIDGPESLLTVSTDQALQYGLASGKATSAADLAAQRGLSIVERYEPSAGDWIVKLLGSDAARIIFIIIFINALIVSLKTPGTGAPEAITLLSLGCLLGIPLLTGYAQWWEIAMVLVGIGLIAFEIFVFPGHLVSLFVGSLMVLGGILLTFVGDIWSAPGGMSLPGSRAAIEHAALVTVSALAASMLVFSWVRTMLPKLPFASRLILRTAPGGKGKDSTLLVARPAFDPGDQWPFLGTTGIAISDLAPGGTARFPYASDIRATSVVSESGYIAAGSKVAVREVHGNRVVVRAI